MFSICVNVEELMRRDNVGTSPDVIKVNFPKSSGLVLLLIRYSSVNNLSRHTSQMKLGSSLASNDFFDLVQNFLLHRLNSQGQPCRSSDSYSTSVFLRKRWVDRLFDCALLLPRSWARFSLKTPQRRLAFDASFSWPRT